MSFVLLFVTDKRKRLIKSKPKVQHRHDTMLTATSMIIGTKSQSFPSPLSTSIDFDNLMATSSSCCPTIYRNQSSFRQFVWRNKLDFGDIKCIAGACLRFAMERTLKIWKKTVILLLKCRKKCITCMRFPTADKKNSLII